MRQILPRNVFHLAIFTSLGLVGIPAHAEDPTTLEPVEVTTSKVPVALSNVAANVSVVSGEELRRRGANDLRTALSLVAGVDIAPGGDGGPASSVPALWGLREFDAFLLVVDGIPSGGAFTPALATLNLANVERIEILKGAAPVSYGATSFVGVIHVIHYAAGAGATRFEFGIGSRGSAHLAAAIPLAEPGAAWAQSVLFDADKTELKSDRSGWDRAHVLYRGAGQLGEGEFTVDADYTSLSQDPVSPHPREAGVLTDRFPLDGNINPRGAKQDEDRGQLAFGYVMPTGIGDWSTRLAVARSNADTVRGFLREDFADDGITPNADGYQQNVHRTELYLDSHVATPLSDGTMLVWGVDHLYGKGDQDSQNFEYATFADGSNVPDWRTLPIDETTHLDDKRNFTGVYADLNVAVTDAWRIEAGLRYNHTSEKRNGFGVDLTGDEPELFEVGSEHRSDNRLSGALGTSFRFWQDGSDYLTGYASYRNTFKPAVIDFGPEPESEILEPEDAQSGELGLKGHNLDGRFEWDVSVFRMNFHNLVVSQNVDGLPGLANAGNERFKGAETELRWNVADGLSVLGSYAYHDARFADYSQLFGDTLTQLDGKLLEMSPQHIGSAGVIYGHQKGLRANLVAGHVGSRYLNKRNTSLADSYTTVDAGIGYAFDRWELRLDGYNLSDRRDPVAESELGDAQYYRLQARSYFLTARLDLGSH
ncbi:MAG TPA: TonB-dependent receptor [Dokdonella sp.]|uniref:TonB-dependent receptor n=1 Tax=Dokdonella sp. TaxID=2291710 RepID=UPI002BBA1212|nr:TonB-dependent receptor [Dokdonella sp.]HOX71302.1 TonB-dependent receptor [Dokdonella sp.]